MSIEEKYPHLYNFIGAWFPDSDFENSSDKEIVGQFVKVSGKEKTGIVFEECKNLLKNDKNLLSELEKLSNRYFDNIKEAETWLVSIKKYLEDAIK